MFVLLIISIFITVVYSAFVLVSLFGFNKIKSKTTNHIENNNKVSVVIAVRNEEENIEQCINSLQNQDYDKTNFEIIVVNDHSEDSTLSILTRLNVKNLVVISLPEGITSKKEALKMGVEKAQFNIIAATDADCFLPINWVSIIAKNVNENTDMLLGPVVLFKEKGLLNAFQQLDLMAMQAFQFGLIGLNQPILNNGANLSFKKESFKLVGGYDNYETPSGDDVFLLEKFIKCKLRLHGLLDIKNIVETNPMKTVRNFIEQRIRWASKSKFYTGKMLKFLSLIILFQNFVQLFIYSQVLLGEKFNNYFIFLLLSKWLIDFILLFLVATFFDRSKSLLYFIPVQIIYPFYIIGVSIASIFLKFEWKGRKY